MISHDSTPRNGDAILGDSGAQQHFPSHEGAFCLKLAGSMTFEYRQELEEKIINAMRRHKSLEADLSDVREIDLYGVHLLGLLKSVGAVIAISPCVEEASRRLLISCRGASLGRMARGGCLLSS